MWREMAVPATHGCIYGSSKPPRPCWRVVANFSQQSILDLKKIKESLVAILNNLTLHNVTESIPSGYLIQTLVKSMHGKRAPRYPDNSFFLITSLPPKPTDVVATGLEHHMGASDEVAELSQLPEAKDATPGPTLKQRKSSNIDAPIASSERRCTPSRAAKAKALKVAAKHSQSERTASPVAQKRSKKKA
ncbi:hypothetical protein H0H87_002670 [Tephrocybe sp. NHM501043]|nr:hypothetical protein H0H87_002670 [Tephrocybe sp. NHM501043]